MTRVLLVAAPWAGKTAVGTALAARTGWPYLDDAALLERASGRTPRALLAAEGEPALRAAESRTLTLLLGLPEPLVAGVAAGVVLDAADRERLRTGGHVVWLRATAPVPSRRAAAGVRGWLGADAPGDLARLSEEPDALFAQVADQVIDVDAVSAVQAARAIVAGLPGHSEP